MKYIFRWMMVLTFCLCLALPTRGWAMSAEEKSDVLTFVKDYLLLESKNSGIFKLTNEQTGEARWFELYGILSDVKTIKDLHTVVVDADVFGYEDTHYILYFDVQKIEGRWVMMNKRIGPRHQRQLTNDSPSTLN